MREAAAARPLPKALLEAALDIRALQRICGASGYPGHPGRKWYIPSPSHSSMCCPMAKMQLP